MGQRAPSDSRQIAVAVAFAFSCFGLLLFLWSAFGGPVPFAPEGYRVKVPFNEAHPARGRVGRAHLQRLGRQGQEDRARGRGTENSDLAVATIEIDDALRADPRGHAGDAAPEDAARRDLRRADPGHARTPGTVAEDGSLPPAQVSESVQLDEIFRTFDEPHPRRLPDLDAAGGARASRAAAPTSRRRSPTSSPSPRTPTGLLRVLDTQEQAVGAVRQEHRASSSTRSPSARASCAGLIQNSGTVFATTARRNEDLRGDLQGPADLPRRVTADARPGSKTSRRTPTR